MKNGTQHRQPTVKRLMPSTIEAGVVIAMNASSGGGSMKGIFVTAIILSALALKANEPTKQLEVSGNVDKSFKPLYVFEADADIIQRISTSLDRTVARFEEYKVSMDMVSFYMKDPDFYMKQRNEALGSLLTSKIESVETLLNQEPTDEERKEVAARIASDISDVQFLMASIDTDLLKSIASREKTDALNSKVLERVTQLTCEGEQEEVKVECEGGLVRDFVVGTMFRLTLGTQIREATQSFLNKLKKGISKKV